MLDFYTSEVEAAVSGLLDRVYSSRRILGRVTILRPPAGHSLNSRITYVGFFLDKLLHRSERRAIARE